MLVSADTFQTDLLDGVQHNSMHWLGYAGDVGEIMHILHTKNPALINSRNIWNETPLHWNIEKKLPIEAMQSLIALGSDVNATFVKTQNIPGTNQFGQLQLQLNGVQYLLERTSFTFACEQHEIAKAKYIMKLPQFNGAQYIDPQQFTIIHWALELKDSQIVHELCTRHPNLLDRPDVYNKTPLAWAVEYFVTTRSQADHNIYKHFISELVSHGAQISDAVRACAGPSVMMLDAVLQDVPRDHDALVLEYVAMGDDGFHEHV